jgi:predicted deacylase
VPSACALGWWAACPHDGKADDGKASDTLMSGALPHPSGPMPPALPHFEVLLTAPRLDAWLPGNRGVPGFTTLESGQPGPHVCLTALTHGNEIAGAIVLDQLLRHEFRPLRGRLTIGFVNLAAYGRFDPRHPTASRFVDEDFNRVWDPDLLDGTRRSVELDRAREIRPLIDGVDILLDLHSMLWPSDPLMLSGAAAKGRDLALTIGEPPLVVADHGHISGPRLIDYPAFTDPTNQRAAVLVEAGQHWRPETVETSLAAVMGLLRHVGMAQPADAGAVPAQAGRFAEVTMAVTAATASFVFLQPFRGGDVVAERGTLIAMDGHTEIRTPHDDCLLVMPSLRPSRGHTAVRLAQFMS